MVISIYIFSFWGKPQMPTRTLPLDPAGGLLSPVPLFCPLRNKFLAMPFTHPSAVVTQFTIISCAVEILRLVTSDDIMTSLLKKLPISIKIHVVRPLCSVSKLSTESVGSRRGLVANSVHTADADSRRDSTVESRRRWVLGLN